MRLIDYTTPGRAARLITAAVLTAIFGFMIASSANAAGSIAIDKLGLDTADSRKLVSQYGKATCKRGGSSSAFRVLVGKKTRECFYRTPVVGRDVDMGATARLFSSTPKKVRAQAYVAVSVRQARDGSRYQLSVYPSGRRYHVKKILDNGRVINLDTGKAGNKINGFDKANRISLRAYNGVAGLPSGTARLLAVANGKRLAVVDDSRGNLLEGRDTTFSIGSKRNATGAKGSFTRLVLRIPDPF